MLTALKIAGFILLGIIGFIVLSAALILIAPFCYKISGDKPEKTEDGFASLVIRWLFPLLHVSVIYDKDGPFLNVRVFGIRVFRYDLMKLLEENTNSEESEKDSSEEDLANQNQKDAQTEGDLTNQTSKDEQTNDISFNQTSKEPESEGEDGDFDEDELDGLSDEELIELLKEPDEFEDLPLPEKAKRFLRKIKEKILLLKKMWYNRKEAFQLNVNKAKRFVKTVKHYWKLVNRPFVKPAFMLMLKQIKAMIKHIWPRKLSLYVKYGSTDPQMAAKVYGYYCMIYPFFGKQIHFEPDFEHDIFTIKGYIKGRIILIRFLFIFFRLLISRDVRLLIKLVVREVYRRGRK